MKALFNVLIYQPIFNLFVWLYTVIPDVGIVIFVVTLIIKLVLYPLTQKSIKAQKELSDLQPKLEDLKQKHKGDQQAIAQGTMKLYKEHGVNPAGGCLPALLQIPVFIGLYQAIINILPGMGGANLNWINSLLYFPSMHLKALPDPNFFGLDLGVKPSQFGVSLFLLIPVMTALLTFVQSKMTVPSPIKHHKDEPRSETKEKEGMEESMSQVQSQMVYLMPVMIGYFAFSFPIGLAIYWNVYTILGIIQQYKIAGWGGLSGFAGSLKLKV